MTLGCVYTIVGFRISLIELLRKCLERDEFRARIREHYIPAEFTFDEFCEFVLAVDWETYRPNESKPKEEKMGDSIVDIGNCGELRGAFYAGTSLKAYPLTHDVDDTGDYIVGEVIVTNDLEGVELDLSSDELLQRIGSAKAQLADAGITEYGLYAVQDDCTCCS
jgi:hypothetical protein